MKANPVITMIAVTILMTPLLTACSQPATPADGRGGDDATVGRKIEDAMITTRIKTAYLFNRHLNSFKIDVDTENGTVTLQGVVRTDIQRDLAEEIAMNAGGVQQVNSRLELSENPVSEPDEMDRTFTQAVIDATTTATVKTKLAFNDGVKASDIDVDTRWGTVTLTGMVRSEAERDLAARLARDVERVKEVENKLEVRG